MARYKVLQDIEAEDKLVGPLTLRQFLYAAAAVICLYICFIAVTKHAAYLLGVFFPPAMVAGFFAFPWGREQPTEIWALAKIRFMVKPRRRIWDQSGMKDLVTITAPKKVAVNYTNGMSQNEVHSRLKALADTIDSRGWAIKNVGSPGQQQDSDRLLGVDNFTQPVPDVDIPPTDDILDEQAPVAQNLDAKLEKSIEERHQRVMDEVARARTEAQQPGPQLPRPQKNPAADPNAPWFMKQQAAPSNAKARGSMRVASPYDSMSTPAPVAAAEPTAAEEELMHRLKQRQQDFEQISYGHMRVIPPITTTNSTSPLPPPPQNDDDEAPEPEIQMGPMTLKPDNPDTTDVGQTPQSAPTDVTPPPNPATLKNTATYANNDDLTIATIARQVNKQPDEVVISLH